MAERRRPTFAELPDDVRGWVEHTVGGRVVRTVAVQGGFSPGVAEALFTAGGAAGFLKAVHPGLNPDTPALLRAEAKALASMPSGLPIAALIDVHDQGDDGWVALLLEHVDGRQAPLPWTPEAADAALASLVVLSAALTPAPAGEWVRAETAVRSMFTCWPALTECADLDPWLVDRVPWLSAAAERALSARVWPASANASSIPPIRPTICSSPNTSSTAATAPVTTAASLCGRPIRSAIAVQPKGTNARPAVRTNPAATHAPSATHTTVSASEPGDRSIQLASINASPLASTHHKIATHGTASNTPRSNDDRLPGSGVGRCGVLHAPLGA